MVITPLRFVAAHTGTQLGSGLLGSLQTFLLCVVLPNDDDDDHDEDAFYEKESGWVYQYTLFTI